MNVVFIIPTGIGCEIGGHSGDATPAAKLIASCCDKLFIHPNVVNASDINEMTENMLYVEGSILDRFLEGEIGLTEVHNNKILVAVNKIESQIVNAVSAARVTMGADIEIVELKTPIKMEGFLYNGKANGTILGAIDAVEQVKKYDFDVLVVNTPIVTNDKDVKEYLQKDGGVNLWGGVEATLSKVMSKELNKPVIHAPVENSEVLKTFNEIVDPRKSAEVVSMCYLHCCLKGAHKAPKITHQGWPNSLARWDIDFLVSPFPAFGPPHRACQNAKIPIIYVAENRTVLNDKTFEGAIYADNYLEAAGIIMAKKAGVITNSVRRPIKLTKIKKKEKV